MKKIFLLIIGSALITSTVMFAEGSNQHKNESRFLPDIQDSTNITDSLTTSENKPGKNNLAKSYHNRNDLYNLQFPTSSLRSNYFQYKLDWTPSLINGVDLKRGLKFAMKTQNKFNSKNDLGTFGKVMIYTNAAAAATLLYIHLKKYGKKYKWFD